MTQRDCIALMPLAELPQPPSGLTAESFGGYTMLFGAPCRRMSRTVSRKAALRKGVVRQQQIEALMPFGTVLPVLHGMTLAPSSVPSLIKANTDLFDRLSQDMAGKIQFQISVHWDEAAAQHKFSTRDTAALARSLKDEMSLLLQTVAVDIAELPITGDLILNCAVLIEATAAQAFDQAIEGIDQIWTEGLRIRQIGPSPAVSFASLRFRTFGKRHLRAARLALGTSASASLEDIARARHAQLKAAHPEDHEALKEAAALLRAHALAGETLPPAIAYQWQEGRASSPELWKKVA